LADRLLPAFDTTTGIPFGTVNLKYGVPPDESEIASTAGAGSLVLEFQTLSIITGNENYGSVAYRALSALYDRRSPLDLVGKHIHVQNGRWYETLSGIGSNSDSFYEYLLKAHFLFRKPVLKKMFSDVYFAVKKYIQVKLI
jgi:mannosidase alpha-like ER degradation enhancer 2